MIHDVTRRSFLAGAGAAALAGCLGSAAGPGTESPTSRPGRSATSSESTTQASGSVEGLPPVAERALPIPMEASRLRDRVVSGGVPKDGIPSIDTPSSVGASEASFLASEDIVFGVVRNGEAKAYPQTILVWHEIVNDVVGGEPVSVTYCPLTGTALGFERGETAFGVSGRLVNNNLIMYDRSTERWWPQVLATSIPGAWNDGPTGQSLRDFRVVWTSWERWSEAHPDTLVLSEDTGHARNYGRDPYGSYAPSLSGYYKPDSSPMFRSLAENDRYPPKRVVMGARAPEGAVAFLKDALRDEKLIEGGLAGTPHLAVYDPVLDTGYVYRNPDGATFAFEGGKVVGADGATHAPGSLPLDAVHTFDAMWFAWSGFYPETEVYE